MSFPEQGLETPKSESSVKKVLEFETPEIPSYVTVRKKKKPVKSCDFIGDTLHTTVIESGNFPISDCQVRFLLNFLKFFFIFFLRFVPGSI